MFQSDCKKPYGTALVTRIWHISQSISYVIQIGNYFLIWIYKYINLFHLVCAHTLLVRSCLAVELFKNSFNNPLKRYHINNFIDILKCKAKYYREKYAQNIFGGIKNTRFLRAT